MMREGPATAGFSYGLASRRVAVGPPFAVQASPRGWPRTARTNRLWRTGFGGRDDGVVPSPGVASLAVGSGVRLGRYRRCPASLRLDGNDQATTSGVGLRSAGAQAVRGCASSIPSGSSRGCRGVRGGLARRIVSSSDGAGRIPIRSRAHARSGCCWRPRVLRMAWAPSGRAMRPMRPTAGGGCATVGAFGRPPNPYQPPEVPAGKVNITDPDSKVMPDGMFFVRGYNAQALSTSARSRWRPRSLTARPISPSLTRWSP
jgi:hypothetical protein